MGRDAGAKQRALDSLHAAIRVAARTGVERLPPIAALAHGAGVSVGAMWRAVQELKARGVLDAAPRAGLTIVAREAGTAGTRRTTPEPHVCLSWEHARNCLQRDIVRGRFTFGSSLPPSKVLMERYGVGYRTLRKALQALAYSRLLERRGRTYRVTGSTERRSDNEVRLVMRSDNPNAVGFDSQRDALLFREIETRASALGLTLKLDTFGYTGRVIAAPDGARRVRLSSAERQRLLGSIVWGQGLEGLEPAELVAGLTRYGRAVAVIDTSGSVDWSQPAQSNELVKVFGLGISTQAGRETAGHLWHLGHRRVAVITATYFQPRIDGIVSFYEQVGLRNEVAVYAPVQRLFDPPPFATPDHVQLQDALNQMVDRGANPANPLHRLLADSLRVHGELVQRAVTDGARQASLLPLFEQALTQSGVTAWILGNDEEAVLALEFLRNRSVRVPDDISVIGFDDTALASSHKLTSYNFNIAGLVHAVYAHVVHPALRERRAQGGAPAQVDGFVTMRGSTGPAQRSAVS